jgi:uncharacterized protein
LPVIGESSYRPFWPFTNCHVQTVFPTLFRKVEAPSYVRRRIDTPDGDFVDLDFSSVGAGRAAVVLHGLEGDSQRSYIRGMVRALNRGNWDAVAMNFRGCSGEPNRTPRLYHSGETEDLRHVVSYLRSHHSYRELALVGFSLGGNVVLKYLGEESEAGKPIITRAAAFSVPCDLTSSGVRFAQIENRLYLKRFLKMLHGKIRDKMKIMPDRINDQGFDRIKSFTQFDDRYTAPIHGFESAEDYYRKASSKPFTPGIRVPTLLVNAADDPFLGPDCFPVGEAGDNPNLFLEIPSHGGHVGFVALNNNNEYWSEQRAISFLNS